MAVWLNKECFRGGIEKQVRLEPPRVLAAVGMNCGFNGVNRINATSMAILPDVSAPAAR